MLGFGLVSGLELSVLHNRCLSLYTMLLQVCMCVCAYVCMCEHMCMCVYVHIKQGLIRRQCQELSIQTELEEENNSTADRKKVDLAKHKRLDRLDGKLDIYEMGDIAQL